MSTHPATPQRGNSSRAPGGHSYAHSVSYASSARFRSPVSPPSPYTPLSLRSFASSSASNPSSALTTPVSAKSVPPGRIKRLSLSSPQIIQNMTASPSAFKDCSLADIAQNWRSRATENGIKVSSGNDSFRFEEGDVDDESFSEANDSNFVNTEEALLPPPFLSTHRRRALSQSQPPVSHLQHVSKPVSHHQTLPTSPLVRRNLMAQNRVSATPPQNRNFAKQLKMKGSLTDPAHTRRREAFGVIPQPSQNIPNSNADTSLDLFDIHENDYEYDHDDETGDLDDSRYQEYSMTERDSAHTAPQQAYGPYPLLKSSSPPMPLFGQPAFADPFSAGAPRNVFDSTIAESVDHYLQQFQQQQYAYPRSPFGKPHPMMSITQTAMSTPMGPPSSGTVSKASTPRAGAPIHPPPSIPLPGIPPSSCSVCSRSNPPRLAILSPCNHPLCSSCLTSALNIVGEKDMECAVCKCSVEDFKLVTNDAAAEKPSVPTRADTISGSSPSNDGNARGKSFLDPLYSSPGSAISSSAIGGLDSAFEMIGPFSFSEGEFRASTPPPDSGKRTSAKAMPSKDAVVLRIDNVPWDITPPTVAAWLQQPVKRVHVLLDRKGKTMSHAFVEVADEAIAGAILRSEVTSGQRGRGAVLGKGRRARGVTITRSSQEELMAALFPSWRGTFDGCRPSLAGLTNDRVIGTLEGGLMTDSEVSALLYLIRSPDAHFLKVPCLPFHVLMSILSKFPADADSRVFWSGGLRDSLYDITYAAVQVLIQRINNGASDEDCNMELVDALVRTAVDCKAFTTQQSRNLSDLLDHDDPADSPSSSSSSSSREFADADVEDEEEDEDQPLYHTPTSSTAASETAVSAAASEHSEHAQGVDPQRLSELAREFGVEAHLVEALAQRLTGSRLV